MSHNWSLFVALSFLFFFRAPTLVYKVVEWLASDVGGLHARAFQRCGRLGRPKAAEGVRWSCAESPRQGKKGSLSSRPQPGTGEGETMSTRFRVDPEREKRGEKKLPLDVNGEPGARKDEEGNKSRK